MATAIMATIISGSQRKFPPETGGLQDWRLEIADCRLARICLFSLASKLAVGAYRVRARLRFLLLAKIWGERVGVAR